MNSDFTCTMHMMIMFQRKVDKSRNLELGVSWKMVSDKVDSSSKMLCSNKVSKNVWTNELNAD